MFQRWLDSESLDPYGSFGDGAAMRVSPIAWLARDEAEVLDLAQRSAAATHGHARGIAGAQATALAMWRARAGCGPDAIRSEIADRFGYDLSRSVAAIRPTYGFDETCDGTVPEALISALEASNHEDAVRNAVSLGGDADTLACIAGGLTEAMFGLPAALAPGGAGTAGPGYARRARSLLRPHRSCLNLGRPTYSSSSSPSSAVSQSMPSSCSSMAWLMWVSSSRSARRSRRRRFRVSRSRWYRPLRVTA